MRLIGTESDLLMVEIDREDNAIACPHCRTGYAERVPCTTEELRIYNCDKKYECCARAFVCGACGYRHVTRAPSPEVDRD